MSKEDIKIAAGELRSFANASTMLIEQVDSTTDIFFASQTEDLLDKVQTTAKNLDGSGGENEAQRGRAARIAAEIADDISRMHENRNSSSGLKPDIERLSHEAKSIEDALRQ